MIDVLALIAMMVAILFAFGCGFYAGIQYCDEHPKRDDR